jgi:hypothetical protein
MNTGLGEWRIIIIHTPWNSAFAECRFFYAEFTFSQILTEFAFCADFRPELFSILVTWHCDDFNLKFYIKITSGKSIKLNLPQNLHSKIAEFHRV